MIFFIRMQDVVSIIYYVNQLSLFHVLSKYLSQRNNLLTDIIIDKIIGIIF